jgi:haloalkane dehalogenase
MIVLNSKLWIISLSTAMIMACKSEKEVLPEEPATPVIVSDTVFNSPTYGYILRTPDSLFKNLKDYTFKPNYVFLEANNQMRMHYLDEGPKTGKVILLMHGNPSWVYNFRKLIPQLTQAGYRVICPDLIGFGRSDKPASRAAHTYDNQVKWVETFIKTLNLTQIHLSCQDWGGIIGLRVAALNQSRFAKIVISNTTLFDGTNVTQSFRLWRTGSQSVATYSSVIERSTYVELDSLEEKAYDAPFPEERFKAGPRELPLKVPIDPKDAEALENKQHWETFKTWNIPILTIFSEEDNITTGEQIKMQRDFIGAQGQAHAILKQSSHFIREDQPTEMSRRFIEFFK